MLPICGDITKIVLKNNWWLLFKMLWLWKIITFGKWKGAGFYWIEFWDSFQTALHKPRLQFIIIIIISLIIVLVGLDSHTKYTRLGSFNRRCLFSLRKETRSPWSRPCFVICRQLSSHSALTWPVLCAVMQEAALLSLPVLLRTPVQSH